MATWDTVRAKAVANSARWDAEFFVNEYNEFLRSIFTGWKEWISLADASSKLTSGHTPLRHDVSIGDTPFVTVECIDPLGLNYAKTKRVWMRHAQGELTRACAKKGDILITIKRRIGVSCPILDDPGLMAVNQDVVVMTPKAGLRPAYIAAVLNSRVDQFQALRHATEQMNPYINVGTLGQILIPRVCDSTQKKIEKVVQDRLNALKQSAIGYSEAEAELLDGLGWGELQQQPAELTYICDFADLTTAARSDAEYFQPQHHRLARRLESRGMQSIGEFCTKPTRGVQPSIIEGGNIIVVDSKAVRPQGVEPATSERTSRALYDLPANAKARVQRGDVLLNSTGRGTLGRAACYQLDTPALCDNHVAILRPDPKVCDPVYLALFLNSPAGLTQSERFQTGSSGQLEIYPEHIQQFLIYLPRRNSGAVDIAWQKRLAEKVEAATAAKVVARTKLEEAKRLAEDALTR